MLIVAIVGLVFAALTFAGTGVGIVIKLTAFTTRMDDLLTALSKRVRKLEKRAMRLKDKEKHREL